MSVDMIVSTLQMLMSFDGLQKWAHEDAKFSRTIGWYTEEEKEIDSAFIYSHYRTTYAI